jgi:hypothetical protein
VKERAGVGVVVLDLALDEQDEVGAGQCAREWRDGDRQQLRAVLVEQ